MMISILCFFLKTLVLSFLGSNFIQYVPNVDLILVHWVKEEKEKHVYNLLRQKSNKSYTLR